MDRSDEASPLRTGWPTSLVEMGQRVPMMCHMLMRAVLDEDAQLAARIVAEDETIDELEKRLFEETEDLMRRDPRAIHNGLLIYRAGRELERIGDLMQSIAEDIIFLNTGTIVRHEQKRMQGSGTLQPERGAPGSTP
jgi:phosphate transport system protein